MNLLETTPTTYRFEGGVELVRVTAPLSLVHRFDGINLDVLAHAQERGKGAHKGVWLIEGGNPSGIYWPSVHAEVRPYLDAYLEAKRVLGFVVVEKERLVWSRVFGFAGRLDLLVEGIGPALSLPDIKTGEEHWSHALQTAAYEVGYREQTGTRKRIDRYSLYLKNTGKYVLKPWKDRSDFKSWCAIRDTYNLILANGGTV